MVDKTCNKCNESKDESLFRKGRNSCKECDKKARRETEAKKKELANKSQLCTKCNENKTMDKFSLNSDCCKQCEKAHRDQLKKLVKKCSKTQNACIHCYQIKDLDEFIKGRNTCRECDNSKRRNMLEKERNSDRNFDKTCTKCNETMKATYFKVGCAYCRTCEGKQKKQRLEKAKKNLPTDKTCTKCDKKQSSDNFRLGENVCYECSKDMLYKWRLENPEKCEAINKKYRSQDGYRERENKGKRKRYNTDPQENIRQNYRRYLREYIFNDKIIKKFNKICDCEREKFRDWIEYNFQTGMTWENYGPTWNLDHTKPCSSFDLTKDDELKECFNWKNTIPVYPKTNLKKHNKVDDDLIDMYKSKVKMFESNSTQRQIKLNKIRSKKLAN